MARLVATAVERRGATTVDPERVTVVDVVTLVDGRPGVVDVVADAGGQLVHVAVGLRPPGDEARFVGGGGDPVLGIFDDRAGLAVAFDAMADEETATAVLQSVVGMVPGTHEVSPLTPLLGAQRVVFDDHIVLVVFDALTEQTGEWVRLLQGLTGAGFDRMPAPIAFWRRSGRDLGIVHEMPSGAVDGATLALQSVRALLTAGGTAAQAAVPAVADPDAGRPAGPTSRSAGSAGARAFVPEAAALGALTGRLHMALHRAFGARPGDVVAWSAAVRQTVRDSSASLAERADIGKVVDDLATLRVPCTTIRSHGDLRLGRVALVGGGWMLAGGPDTLPYPEGRRQSPLADVAGMLCSFGRVAAAAVAELADVGPVPGEARRRAGEWERQVRRAFVGSYLAVPGIATLVPADRGALRTVTSAFELEHAVRQGLASFAPG